MTLNMATVEHLTNRWLEVNTLADTKPEMVWVDIETDGLDEIDGKMLEIGFLVTDRHGFVVPDGSFRSVIKDTPDPIDWTKANHFVRNMHRNNGLAERVTEAKWSNFNYDEVETAAIQFLTDHFGTEMKTLRIPISGSSVGFDRKWIDYHMPEITNLFSYRNIDVSSFKEAALLLNPDVPATLGESWSQIGAHRVIADLVDSIEEYRHYIAEFLWTTENAQGFVLEFSEGKRVLADQE